LTSSYIIQTQLETGIKHYLTQSVDLFKPRK